MKPAHTDTSRHRAHGNGWEWGLSGTLEASHNICDGDTLTRTPMRDEDNDATEETLLAIGRFIYEFSQLEFAIRALVAEKAGVGDEHFSAIMVHDVALLFNAAK